MELGLYVGRGEPREGTDSTSREVSMSSGDNAMSEMEPSSQPSLQLELKLSWYKDQQQNYRTANNGIQTNGNIHDSHRDITPTPSASHIIKPESRSSWRSSDDEDIIGQMPRKKLRLTKEQSCYLEESFKEHSTLNPKQKLAISKKLNLRPRQVEVWFQNRRARTKLKQTEVDFEYLKRCCESLTEENRRLHRELHELRAIKFPMPQLRLQSPNAATLRLCPSCEQATTKDSGGGGGQRLFGGFGINSNKEAKCNKLAYQVG